MRNDISDEEMGFGDDGGLMEMDLCLCGRDPDDREVQEELARVMALRLRYGLVISGCLCQAALAFDRLSAVLEFDEAQELEYLVIDIEDSLGLVGSEEVPTGWASKAAGPRLH